ncbi:MAG: Uma2 family endonuclease [Pseudomonadota bacterium]
MHAPTLFHADDRFTWQDYQAWPDEERWELIDGVAYAMSPAPSTRHQRVSGNLFVKFTQMTVGKPCKPFIAPTDVKLSDQDVVQPDILVVCDPTRITPTHIEGAPELVVEVLSPHTSTRDLREKKALYERAGVAEYLVVDPLENYAIRFLLTDDGYDKGTVFGPDQMLELKTLADQGIPLWEVFELPAPASEANPAQA